MVRAHGLLKAHGMFTGIRHCDHGGGSVSIFNTTYNINNGCSSFGFGGGGGISGFWGGFGAGLGQALGGFFGGFGNMFGGFGFGNMFGGFGMGGLFGGFGMGGLFGGFGNMWGGFGNMWGGFGNSFSNFWGSDSGSKVSDYTPSSSKSKKSKSKEVEKDTSSEPKATTTPKSTVTGQEDKDQAKLSELENSLKNVKTKEDLQKIYDEVSELVTKPLDETYADTNKKHYARILSDVLDLAKKNKWQLNGLLDELLSTKTDLDSKKDDEKNFEFINKMSDAERASYYKAGYSNYAGEELVKNVKDAHDNSGKTRDVVNINGKKAEITKADDGNHPKQIVIQDTTPVTYEYVGKAGSEYIYKSKVGGQLYALQYTKGTNDTKEYHLMQYKYMKGYGIPDVTTKKK